MQRRVGSGFVPQPLVDVPTRLVNFPDILQVDLGTPPVRRPHRVTPHDGIDPHVLLARSGRQVPDVVHHPLRHLQPQEFIQAPGPLERVFGDVFVADRGHPPGEDLQQELHVFDVVHDHTAKAPALGRPSEGLGLGPEDRARVPDEVQDSEVRVLPHEAEESPQRQTDGFDDEQLGDVAPAVEVHQASEVRSQVDGGVVVEAQQTVGHFRHIPVRPAEQQRFKLSVKRW